MENEIISSRGRGDCSVDKAEIYRFDVVDLFKVNLRLLKSFRAVVPRQLLIQFAKHFRHLLLPASNRICHPSPTSLSLHPLLHQVELVTDYSLLIFSSGCLFFVNQLLLASLLDPCLEEALVPVPVHQELPLECLLEAGQHEVLGLRLFMGEPLAKVLRGDRKGDGGPGDLEGRAWLACRGLQGLVGRVKSRCLAAGDKGSGDRVGGNDSAGGGVVVGAKSMRVRIVLRWKRVEVD
jgi:hypothetical protein